MFNLKQDKIFSITLIVDREGNSAVQLISLMTARLGFLTLIFKD